MENTFQPTLCAWMVNLSSIPTCLLFASLPPPTLLRKQRRMLSNVPLVQFTGCSSSLAQPNSCPTGRARCPENGLAAHQPHFVHSANFSPFCQWCSSRNWVWKHHCIWDCILKDELSSELLFFARCQTYFRGGEG